MDGSIPSATLVAASYNLDKEEGARWWLLDYLLYITAFLCVSVKGHSYL